VRPSATRCAYVIYTRASTEIDLRDVLFYNRVRPKFFASEPPASRFAPLFSFLWLG